MELVQCGLLDHSNAGHEVVVVVGGKVAAVELMLDHAVIQAGRAVEADAPLGTELPVQLDRRPVFWPQPDLGLGEVFRVNPEVKFRRRRAPPVQRLGGGDQFPLRDTPSASL